MASRKRPDAPAEGLHGPKTRRALIEQLENGAIAGSEEREGKLRAGMTDNHPKNDQHSHLIGDREQHDEADKNSDANRLQKDLGRGRRVAGADAPANPSQPPKS